MAKGATLNPEHLEALRHGREMANAVRAYLEALGKTPRKRGRQRTRESIEAQIEEAQLLVAETGTNVVTRLKARQALRNLNEELVMLDGRTDLGPLEETFTKYVAEYSASNGIVRETWLDEGVPKAVLDAAGLLSSRGRRTVSEEYEDDEV